MKTPRSAVQFFVVAFFATLVVTSTLAQPAAPSPNQPAPGGPPGGGGFGGRGGRGGGAALEPQTPVAALATLPPVNETNAAAALKDIKVPEEFDVTIFATPPSVNYPTYVAAAPDGTLYVAVDGNGAQGRAPHLGRILRLRDTTGAGHATEVKAFVADVDSPRGLIWDHDRLYSLHPPTLSAYIDRDGDGVPEEEQVLIKGIGWTLSDRSVDHGEEGLVLGIDGWIYATMGDYGFLKAEGADGRKVQLRGGGVIRVRPDGTGLEIWATGTRNIYDMALSPLLDGFARDNTNDGGGWDTRFHHFTGLTEHGYPSLFKNFTNEIIQPVADYGGGGATGALWLDEPGFPERWNNAPLTADWGRNQIYHHTLTPNGATYKVTQEEFIGLTRVTDLDVDANSTLYISSWKGAVFNWAGPNAGYIARATPKGYKAEPLPDFDKLSNAGLVGLLESPSQRRRLEAQRALLRRNGIAKEIAPLLEKLAGNQTKQLSYRVAGLFTLKQVLGAASHPAMVKLAKDGTISAWAIRALGDRIEETGNMPVAPMVAGLKSNDPRVRKESLIALNRGDAHKQIPSMTPLMADADPIVAHTAVQVLKQLKASDASFAVLDSSKSTEPMRSGALRVLQSLHEPQVVDGLITRLNREVNSQNRLGLIMALCRLSNIQGEWSGAWWGTRPDTRGPYFQPEAWSETPKISAALDAALEKADAKETVMIGHEFDRHRVPVGKAVTKLIAQADSEPSLVPLITAQLADAEDVPAGAVPLMIKVAGATTSTDDMRAQAVMTLAKTDSVEGWNLMPSVLQKIQPQGGRGFGGRGGGQGGRGGFGGGAAPGPGGPAAPGAPATPGPVGAPPGAGGRGGRGGGAGGGGFGGFGANSLPVRARTAVLNSPKMDRFYVVFVEQAAKIEGDVSKFSDGILLNLAARKIGTAQTRDAAAKALDTGWTEPKRRIQIMQAAASTRDSSRALQIVEATNDADKDVAQAAQSAVQQLGIDPEKIRADASLPRLGTMPVPEVLDAVVKTVGDVRRGQQLFTELSCVACHTTTAAEAQKGPFLGTIANTYKRRELAEAILLPNKTIAQGFVANHFEMKDGTELDGFVVREAADVITIRTITAQEYKLPGAQIAKREKQEKSLMPEGLAAGLTVQELASLLDYLEGLAKP